jgi:hypothetical protein
MAALMAAVIVELLLRYEERRDSSWVDMFSVDALCHVQDQSIRMSTLMNSTA